MKRFHILLIAITVLVSWLIAGCKKDNDIQERRAQDSTVVITKPVTSISATSVVSGGEVSSSLNITDKGLVWGTDSSRLTTTGSNKISSGAGSSSFSDTIQNLKPNTTYYLRAYAVHAAATIYGATNSFTTPLPGPDVYVTGYHGGSAAYWKNGKLVLLANGTYAHSIFVAGEDVYVAGEYNSTSGLKAMYWKNGTPVTLTDGSNAALANAIYVAGNDVYVAGYELQNNDANLPVAKYWKNGIAFPLTDGTPGNTGIAYSIYADGKNVFVSGSTGNHYLGNQVATYWKNGIAVALSDSNEVVASAHSIFVKDADVYIAGKEKPGLGIGGVPIATYWKNGQATRLSNGRQFAGANSIFVSGDDVYVAGYEYDGLTGYSAAKYWKNGIAIPLTDATEYGNAYAIYVKDNDVYVAGGVGNDFNAIYWKNGVAQPLEITEKFSRTVSIYVK